MLFEGALFNLGFKALFLIGIPVGKEIIPVFFAGRMELGEDMGSHGGAPEHLVFLRLGHVRLVSVRDDIQPVVVNGIVDDVKRGNACIMWRPHRPL